MFLARICVLRLHHCHFVRTGCKESGFISRSAGKLQIQFQRTSTRGRQTRSRWLSHDKEKNSIVLHMRVCDPLEILWLPNIRNVVTLLNRTHAQHQRVLGCIWFGRVKVLLSIFVVCFSSSFFSCSSSFLSCCSSSFFSHVVVVDDDGSHFLGFSCFRMSVGSN